MSALHLSPKTGVLGIVLFVLLVIWISFHRQIQSSLSVRLFLSSKNAHEEFFEELAKQVKDPVDFLQRSWATGRVTHRQLVATFLKDNATSNSPWLSRADPLVLACTVDADASVRELGLAILEAQRSPWLFQAARAQLDDLDPLVRMLGLDYVRKSDPKRAVPILIRLLDDPDLRIVVAAEVGLMRASAEDYGVRARLAIPPQEGAHLGRLDPANVEAIRRGVEQRKAWWRVHQKDYDIVDSPAPLPTPFAPDQPRLPAPDFTLRDLEGKSLSLSKLKGKVVLLNFWATWCTACLAEIPDLIALRETVGSQVVILGVALDGVPDEHGDAPGFEHNEKAQREGTSVRAVRVKVRRAAKMRRINYPVLLDPKNSIGGQYNGGELPTTVILDAEGRVRRRFIGERNLSVFQAMVAEAEKPLTTERARLQAQANTWR
jgi:thiol-disulfide isomerase/thioredoxin